MRYARCIVGHVAVLAFGTSQGAAERQGLRVSVHFHTTQCARSGGLGAHAVPKEPTVPKPQRRARSKARALWCGLASRRSRRRQAGLRALCALEGSLALAGVT